MQSTRAIQLKTGKGEGAEAYTYVFDWTNETEWVSENNAKFVMVVIPETHLITTRYEMDKNGKHINPNAKSAEICSGLIRSITAKIDMQDWSSKEVIPTMTLTEAILAGIVEVA